MDFELRNEGLDFRGEVVDTIGGGLGWPGGKPPAAEGDGDAVMGWEEGC